MPLVYRHPLPAKPKPVPSVMTIKPHQSWVCPMGMVLTIVVMGTIGLFLWQSSVQAIRQNRQIAIEQQLEELDKSRLQLEKAFQQNASLIAQNATLTAKNKEIRDELAELTERVGIAQAEQKTYASVLQSFSQSQEFNQDLKEELSFYRRLLTSPKISSKNQAVAVANFTLNYDKKSGHYPYKLVLTQWTKELKVAEGIVQIDIIGKAYGKTKRLKMNQMTKNSVDSLKYELLYFRRIENELKLPKRFTPHHLIIRLLAKGEKKANEVRFKWKELQKRSN